MFELDDYSPNFALDCAKLSKGICVGVSEEKSAIAANVIASRCSSLVAKTDKLNYSDRVQALKDVRFAWKDIAKVIIKVLVHKAFRVVWVLNKKKLKRKLPNKVFKAWVEVNVESWGGEFSVHDSCVLILPFPLKLSRQLNFIKGLKGDLSYSLYGYAYSFKKLVQHIIYRDIMSLALLENSAATSYVRDVRELGVAKAFHMDDVEVQSYVASSHLIKKNVLVNFRNHGIGRYSPYFTASSAVFFNESQRIYYESLNSFEYVELMYYLDRNLEFEKSALQQVVFVSQLINGLPAEYELLEERILEKLSVIGKELGFTLAVKLHPNGRNANFLKGYPSVDSLKPSKNCTTIFFTNYSTSYYTFEQYGPTYLIRSSEVDPSIFFGDEERIVDEAAFSDSASFTKAITNEVVLFDTIPG